VFGIGGTEFAIILIFGFLLFGPDKLPGVGRTVGRAIRQFREAEEGFTQVVQSEVVDPFTQAAESGIRGEDSASAKPAKETAKAEGGEASEPAPANESFAERKARMEAERAAAKQRPVDKPDEPADDVDSDEDIKPQRKVAPMSEPAAPAAPATGKRSLAALYGLDEDDEDASEGAAEDADAAPADDGEEEGA
jgi:sec-independent protein translocase protein TatB